MAKRSKRPTGKTNGLTANQRARLDERRRLQAEIRAERVVTKLANELRRRVFGRDTAIENLAHILSDRQKLLDGKRAPENES